LAMPRERLSAPLTFSLDFISILRLLNKKFDDARPWMTAE